MTDQSEETRMPGSENESKVQYERPTFQLHSLRMITLGGSPGRSDSGDPGNQSPFGFETGSSEEDASEEGFDEWGDGKY